jgi:hypothetical protein
MITLTPELVCAFPAGTKLTPAADNGSGPLQHVDGHPVVIEKNGDGWWRGNEVPSQGTMYTVHGVLDFGSFCAIEFPKRFPLTFDFLMELPIGTVVGIRGSNTGFTLIGKPPTHEHPYDKIRKVTDDVWCDVNDTKHLAAGYSAGFDCVDVVHPPTQPQTGRRRLH